MHGPQTYFPYEELRAEFSMGEGILRMSTPWTVVEAEVTPDSSQRVAAACEDINNFSAGVIREEASDLLTMFKDQHIAYMSPRQISLVSDQCTRTKKTIRLSAESPPDKWVDAYLATVAHAVESVSAWSFDVSDCLAHSRVPDTDVFDAASAYRFIMHWVFIRLTSASEIHTRFYDLLANLLTDNEPAFFCAAKHFLRQYHHVTSTSFDCLLPALETLSFSKKLVHRLVHEEQGHGRYTADSLRKLGVGDPASLPLLPESVAIMDLLRITTTLNPLTFACLFNVFELGGEQDEDPIAALLERSSRPEAAAGVRAHFELNKAGAHFTNGIRLIEEIGGVDAYTVIEAARCVELNLVFTQKMYDRVTEGIVT